MLTVQQVHSLVPVYRARGNGHSHVLRSQSVNLSPNLRLAQASIVALYGSIGARASLSEGVWTLLPHERPMRIADAARHLANLRKPLVCVAVSQAARLFAAIWTLDEPRGLRPALVTMARELFHGQGNSPGSNVADVLVTSDAGDTVILSCEECERWFREYEFPLAEILVSPGETTSASSAKFIVRVRPLGTGSVHSFEPPT